MDTSESNMTGQSFSRVFRYLNSFGLLALEVVLAYALYDQFFEHDLPCPLCLLQRIGFVSCMIAVLLNITYGPKPWHYGLLLLSAIFGATVALRQISLHVIPGTPAYGDALLGLHFYTWAFIAFSTILFVTSLALLFPNQYSIHKNCIRFSNQPLWIQIIVVIALGIILINAVSALFECGLGVCAENPTSYKLLK